MSKSVGSAQGCHLKSCHRRAQSDEHGQLGTASKRARTKHGNSSTGETSTMSSKFVILDCDGGSDDAWALLLLLRAEQACNLKLLAITTAGCGNTTREHAARNMRRMLTACGREDVPMYLGAVEPLACPIVDKRYFHGVDGFGDVLNADDYADINDIVQPMHAVTAIYEICRARPQQVTVVAIGPLTNLALGYSMYGEQFGKHFKDIVIMGGNYQGVGNSTRSAEFNFHSDPEAAHAVLLKARCPIVILPWEPCMEGRFTLHINWRLQDLGKRAAEAQHAAITILNKVESSIWKPGCNNWNPCDALLVAAWLFEDQFVKKHSNWHATVDLTGTHTRGQMVLDHLQEHDKHAHNVRIIELLDVDFFKSIVEWIAELRDDDFLQVTK